MVRLRILMKRLANRAIGANPEPEQCFSPPSAPRARAARNLVLQWHITDRCNLRCKHCYQEGYSGEEMGLDGLMQVHAQFRELMAAEQQRTGRKVRGHLNITGGEPFIRKDFLELLTRIRRHRNPLTFAILSNGTFIDRGIAKELKQLNASFVQVSVEGTRSTHDSIRGTGSHERTAAALKHLAQEKVPTLISFTAHRANFREFPEVARFGRELDAKRVWADRLVPQGHGTDLTDLVLTRDETQELFLLMAQARGSKLRQRFARTEISMARALQFLEGGGRPYQCAAGDTLITIQPNGDLYPCRRMPIVTGNVRETPLVELYQRSGLFQALRNRGRISEGCGSCFFSGLCRGGLRCLSYAVTGDPFTADPGCRLAIVRGTGNIVFDDKAGKRGDRVLALEQHK